MPPGITKIRQVKLPVTNLAKSVAWYRQLLDLEPIFEFYEEGGVRGAVLLEPTADLHIALRETRLLRQPPPPQRLRRLRPPSRLPRHLYRTDQARGRPGRAARRDPRPRPLRRRPRHQLSRRHRNPLPLRTRHLPNGFRRAGIRPGWDSERIRPTAPERQDVNPLGHVRLEGGSDRDPSTGQRPRSLTASLPRRAALTDDTSAAQLLADYHKVGGHAETIPEIANAVSITPAVIDVLSQWLVELEARWPGPETEGRGLARLTLAQSLRRKEARKSAAVAALIVEPFLTSKNKRHRRSAERIIRNDQG
jgi:catechol 2,3-dioxygenase-like lactoylglutathione lyase family enzyme